MLIDIDEWKRQQKEADLLSSYRDRAVKSNADEDWIEFGRQMLLLEEHSEHSQCIIDLAFPFYFDQDDIHCELVENKLSVETARLSLVYACRRFIEERPL